MQGNIYVADSAHSGGEKRVANAHGACHPLNVRVGSWKLVVKNSSPKSFLRALCVSAPPREVLPPGLSGTIFEYNVSILRDLDIKT